MLISHLYRCCEFILVLDGIERLYPPYVLVSVQLLHHSSCVARVSASVLPVLIWMIRTWCPSRFGDLGWQQREANTCHLFSATTNNWRGCQHCRPQDRGSASVPLIWAYLCPIFIYIIYMYYIITHLNISQETRLRLEITQQNLHLRLYRCRIMAPSLMPRPAPLFPFMLLQKTPPWHRLTGTSGNRRVFPPPSCCCARFWQSVGCPRSSQPNETGCQTSRNVVNCEQTRVKVTCRRLGQASRIMLKDSMVRCGASYTYKHCSRNLDQLIGRLKPFPQVRRLNSPSRWVLER